MTVALFVLLSSALFLFFSKQMLHQAYIMRVGNIVKFTTILLTTHKSAWCI